MSRSCTGETKLPDPIVKLGIFTESVVNFPLRAGFPGLNSPITL